MKKTYFFHSLIVASLASLSFLPLLTSCDRKPQLPKMGSNKAERETTEKENDAIIEESIKVTVNVNLTDNKDRTAFTIALENGHEDIALDLIKSGAQINKRIIQGETELAFAIRRKMFKVAEELIKRGANPNQIIEAESEKLPPKTPLLSYTIWKSRGKEWDDLSMALIKAGANVNATDEDNNSVLMFASAKGKLEIVKELIKKGANVNTINDSIFSTALVHASYCAYSEIVTALLDAGADINAKDINGDTALHHAVREAGRLGAHRDVTEEDYMKAVRALIRAGADINARNIDGDTAQMIAAANGNRNMVAILNPAEVEKERERLKQEKERLEREERERAWKELEKNRQKNNDSSAGKEKDVSQTERKTENTDSKEHIPDAEPIEEASSPKIDGDLSLVAPKSAERVLIVVRDPKDPKIAWSFYTIAGVMFYSNYIEPENLGKQPRIRIGGGIYRHETQYVDQYGSLWYQCELGMFKSKNNKIYLGFDVIPGRREYRLCGSCVKEDGYYVYHDAPAVISLLKKNGNSYDGHMEGVLGCMDFDTRTPDTISHTVSVTAFPRKQDIIQELCEMASVIDHPDIWKLLDEAVAQHHRQMSEKQKELYELTRFFRKPFKDDTSKGYATRLRRILPALMAGTPISSSFIGGNTALHYAAAMGSKTAVTTLVERGAAINIKNENNQTPLDCLGINRSGLDKWMMQRGAQYTNKPTKEDNILIEIAMPGTSDDHLRPTPKVDWPCPASSGDDAGEQARAALLKQYADALTNGQEQGLRDCFAQDVEYFEDGKIYLEAILIDNNKFFRKYPVRSFSIGKEKVVKHDHNGVVIKAPATCILTDGDGNRVLKKMTYTMRIAPENGELKIFSIISKQDYIEKLSN